MRRPRAATAALLAVATLPAPAWAHGGHAETGAGGLLHVLAHLGPGLLAGLAVAAAAVWALGRSARRRDTA